jgi:malate synthase
MSYKVTKFVKNQNSILSTDAAIFIAKLCRVFRDDIKLVLQKRVMKQNIYDSGILPNFMEETETLRNSEWSCAPLPRNLVNRKVEITGPVNRKMVINAMNSGATHYMADFEDSTCPTWENIIEGHRNITDAVNKTINFTSPDGKVYILNNKTPTLLIRPRGLHMIEKHFLVDEEPCSASIFDFGLHMFNNAKKLVERSEGPYFYLPKLESHTEATLWNKIFNMAQDMLHIPRGTLRATILIETLPAIFELDEMLYELRHHCAGANLGRWDYIFSFIKKLRNCSNYSLAERNNISMTSTFMDAYTRHLINKCHKRGVLAIGGMSAHLPNKKDIKLNKIAIDKIKEDKLREVKLGCDGTWVCHPDFIATALEVFEQNIQSDNQINIQSSNQVSQSELLNISDVYWKGRITKNGVIANLQVVLKYVEAWLRGIGCIALNGLMEDLATAEISRSQIWQWMKHGCQTSDGENITMEWIKKLLDDIYRDEKANFKGIGIIDHKLDLAYKITLENLDVKIYNEFLSNVCYEYI